MFNMMLSFLILVHSYEFLWQPTATFDPSFSYLTALPLLLGRVRTITAPSDAHRRRDSSD